MAAAPTEAMAAPARRGRVRRLVGDPAALGACLVLTLLVLVAAFAPWLTSADPHDIDPSQRFMPPGADAPFGTDHLGRDMLALVLYGGRTSLLVGTLVTAISMAAAIVLGLLAGFYRRVDAAVMRLADGMLAFPGVVLATAASGILGPSVATVVVALSVVLVAPSLRVVRGQVLVVRELPMIEAARAVGVPETRLLRRYVLPALTSPILVQASFIFSAAVLGEAALSFIGLGVSADDVSWGSALTEARNYIGNAPWMVIFPGVALVLTILSLNLLGDSLRDVLDPRQGQR